MVSFGASARLTSPSSTLGTDAATQTETTGFSPADLASKTPPTTASYSDYGFDDSYSTSSKGHLPVSLLMRLVNCKPEGDNT